MKGIWIVLQLLFLVSRTFAFPSLSEEEDFIVIEAAEESESLREARQIPILILNPQGLCTSSRGRSGRCIPFGRCHPFYRVSNDIPGRAFGQKDACSLEEALKEWSEGVCCENLYPPPPPLPGTFPIVLPELEGPILSDLSSPKPTTEPSTTTSTSPAPSTTPSMPDESVCGYSIHYPILYNEDGSVSEEINRIDMEHDLKIVNGWPASKHEWPWIAALFNKGRQFCGGSLISRHHILTAAHCVAQMTRVDVNNLEVRLGEHDIKDAFDTQVVVRKVKKIIRHKGFSSHTLWNDVAIVFLSEAVEYGDTIKPVCLDMSDDPYDNNETATVVGWGSLRESGPQPSVLQEVTLRLWTNEKCKETYGSSSPAGITDHMVCAGRQGKDSCSGDSGGPMVRAKGNRWVQIGIVSWGIGCGKSHYPGVYTRVAKMHEWIANVMDKFM